VRNRLLLVGAVYVAVLLLLTLLANGRVRSAENLVVEQDATNTDLQQRVISLGDADALVSEYRSGIDLLGRAGAGE